MNVQSRKTLFGTKTTANKRGPIDITVTCKKGPFGGTRFTVLLETDTGELLDATGSTLTRGELRGKTTEELRQRVDALILRNYPYRRDLVSDVDRLIEIARNAITPEKAPASPQQD